MTIRRTFIAASMFIWICGAFKANAISDSEVIARLKANRALYAKWDMQPSLREVVDTQKKDVSRVAPSFSTVAVDPTHPPQEFDPKDHPRLKEAASHSDLVVIGTVTRNTSAFTEKAGFIFTDSEFSVEKVLGQSVENRAVSPIAANSEITITSPGGSIFLEGHHVSAYLSNEISLNKGGHYLLFLRYIPLSNSYQRVDLQGFDLNGSTPLLLRKDIPNPIIKVGIADLGSSVNSSVSKAVVGSKETR